MIEDAELLRRYAEEKSEGAFAELVQRRIGLVYSVALRRTGGDTGSACDVTQAVFCDLARKAREVCRRPVLAGWLYRSAHYAAADAVRAERRRVAREQEAHRMNELAHDSADWEALRPALDELLNAMDERDRDAVVLRFFEGRAFAEIGSRLRLTENAARMRVERALEKLRAGLERRGVRSTAAALGLVLANHVTVAAPAGLAASVIGSALAAGVGAAAGATLFMGMTIVELGAVGALALTGAVGVIAQADTNAALREELAGLTTQAAAREALQNENRQLASVAAEVERLRQDDAELKRLEQDLTDAKRALQEKAQLAATEAKVQRRRQLEAGLREKDRLAQLEIDRLNKEGNLLVNEHRELKERLADPELGAAQRRQLEEAARQKMAAIQAKQREVQAFIATTRAALTGELAELRALAPGVFDPPEALRTLGAPGKLELRSGWEAGARAPAPAGPGVGGVAPKP